MEDEIWKNVVGFEGLYEVSNLGRVRSLERTIISSNGRNMILRGQIIKGCYSHAKYLQVNLYDNNRKNNTQKVHRLVAMAFLLNPHNYEHVNHKDFNRENNRLDNLEWCSPKQNMQHSSDAGRVPCGEDHIHCKLKNEDVLDIRKKYSDSMIRSRIKKGVRSELAKQYGVSESLISQIAANKTWKHI